MLLSKKNVWRFILALCLFISSLTTASAISLLNSDSQPQVIEPGNYYQGVYGFLDGFNHEDPLQSLDEMAEQNINLVILYGANYDVKTTVRSKKDAILARQFKKIDRYLAHADSLGIKVIMPVWRLPKNLQQVPYMNEQGLDTAIRYIKRYRNNPALIGWYLMDEPILRLEVLQEKAPEYFYKYVIPALDTLTEALDQYDTSNKIRFGVFERYNKGNYGLKTGARILINRYLTVWGHDQYPFIKRVPREFQNIYYVMRNFHHLNNFVRKIKKPFLFVGQAQSSDANPNWQQRLPTAREFMVQQVYPMLLMSEDKPRYHFGNIAWAFGVMKSTPAGREFLRDVYTPGKRLVDLISAGIANGRIQDISQERNKATYSGEKAIKAGIYDIPENSKIFYNQAWQPHPFRGHKMAIALATQGGRDQDFAFTYPGKVTWAQAPLIAPNHLCTIENFQQQYNQNKQETLLQMKIKPLCPTVLIFDTED